MSKQCIQIFAIVVTLRKSWVHGLTCFSSNVQEQCWVWNNDGTEYFYDKLEWVRVRVEQEHWHDQSPVAPSERESAATMERKAPFSITVFYLRSKLPTL